MDRVQAASGAKSRWHEKGRVAIGGSATGVRIFPLIYWGLKIRICEAKEAARRIAAQRAEREGRRPASGGHDAGNNSKQVRAWRALGRTLCDIQLLVFNIGRADFRSKFVEPFTIMIQTSSSNAMGLQEVGLTASMHMIRAGAALTDARGIIMILGRIMIAASGATAAAQPRNCRLKKYHLWAFTRTHLAHRCWRWFPGLVRHLPHILLGGTMQGVALQSAEFEEPAPRGAAAPEPRSLVALRSQRFQEVLSALELLLEWTKVERSNFQQKVLGVELASNARRYTALKDVRGS